MASLELQLDSAQKLRSLWATILSTPGKLQELLDNHVVTVAAKASINASVDWRFYSGQVDITMYYRAFDEQIADKPADQSDVDALTTQFGPVVSLVYPFIRISLTQDETQKVAIFALSKIPVVGAAYVAANGGEALPIEPPYEKPVVVVPAEPEPTQPGTTPSDTTEPTETTPEESETPETPVDETPNEEEVNEDPA